MQIYNRKITQIGQFFCFYLLTSFFFRTFAPQSVNRHDEGVLDNNTGCVMGK